MIKAKELKRILDTKRLCLRKKALVERQFVDVCLEIAKLNKSDKAPS